MDTPDAPDARRIEWHEVCDRPSLVARLRQMWYDVGRLDYPELRDSDGKPIPTSTVSNLIGKGAEERTGVPSWKTVEKLLVAFGASDDERDAARKAWRKLGEPGRPQWMVERDDLKTQLETLKIENQQLATALREAHARAVKAEQAAQANAAMAQSASIQPGLRPVMAVAPFGARNGPPVGPPVVDALGRLRIKAETYRQANDYGKAVALHSQIAGALQQQHGSSDVRVLEARRTHLDIETTAYQRSAPRLVSRMRRRRLEQRWVRLVRDHQRWLPEGNPATLSLRLRYGYWIADLFDPSTKHRTSRARDLLISLLADCKIYLPPGEPLTGEVERHITAVDDACRTGGRIAQPPYPHLNNQPRLPRYPS